MTRAAAPLMSPHYRAKAVPLTGTTMGFISSSSGKACLNDWPHPLAVKDILELLLNLKRAVAAAGDHVILMLLIREVVPIPDAFLIKCIQGSLPAILGCCEHLVVVIEGNALERAPLKAAFDTDRRTASKRTPPRVFDSLSTAFAFTQPLAPHDVLELQRYALHSFPPAAERG